MNLINLILENKVFEFTESVKTILTEKINIILDEYKMYLSLELNERSNSNILKMGRILKVKKRVRRDASGRMIVQNNARRSAMKGYMISGNTVKRISSVNRFRRSQQLKRSWRGSRRAKLSRSILKRKMSMRRRYSLGLR